MAAITGIYKITNITNGKCYIGQSINVHKRWTEHRRAKSDSAIHGAIRKYGVASFVFEVIETCEVATLNDKEIYFISTLDCIRPKGYNLTSGGNAPTSVSDETRRKQSIAKKGKPSGTKGIKQSEELLQRLSIIRKGKPSPMKNKTHSDEAKEKIAAAGKGRVPWNKGMKMSNEHNEKLSIAHKGQKAWNKGIPLAESTKKKLSEFNTGRIILSKRKKVIRDDGVIFESVTAAAKAINVDHAAVCRALRIDGSKSGGFSFNYYCEEAA